EVFESLNDGDGNSQSRLLYKRLGRGAIAAARLLQEGVLEQDKRVRQIFRKSLEPLNAFTDIKALTPLLSTKLPNSSSWLYIFLIDYLFESNYTENVGAVIILANVLPNDHARIDEVRDYILSAPADYISCIIESLEQRRFTKSWPDAVKPQSWFL